jgi:leader peptidase (prepilin peptidase)/N-methyltransferase
LAILATTAFQGVFLFLLFVLGGIVGSFLNVCIWRVPRGGRIGQPRRSYCPTCRASILWYDNVPVLSFILLRGRCRHCGEPVSWRYPAVELMAALIFPLVYFRQGVVGTTGGGEVAVMLLLVSLLIFASAVDIDFLIIPEEITVFGMIGGLLAGFLLPQIHVGTASYHTVQSLTGNPHWDGLIGSAVGLFSAGLLVLAIALLGALVFQREAMGFGDVSLMAMIGAFFGWKVALMAFFLAPFLGLLYGLPLLLMEDEHVMPYGPWLSLGAILTLVFREDLCYWPNILEDTVRQLV